MAQVTLARRFRRAHSCGAFLQELTEDATMPRVKQASKQKRTTKATAAKVLGAAGLGLSLASSASASTMPAAGIPQSDDTSPNQRFFLGEEEMADVSLATFHLFDRERQRRAASPWRMRWLWVRPWWWRRVRRLPRWRRVRRLPWLRWWRVCWLPRLRCRRPWLRCLPWLPWLPWLRLWRLRVFHRWR